jgi:TonB family protein
MELTRQEENKNRAKSAGGTALVVGLLLLFLILFNIVTPNPPFPESGGGGGQQLALGMMNLGNDNIDYSSMGAVKDVVVEKTPEPQEKIVTVEGGEEVPVPEEKPVLKEDKVVIKPVKPKPVEKPVVKEKTAAEKLAEKFKKNKGKDGGGVGNNEQAGNAGSPDGDPFGGGTGGTGTGDGGGDGEGVGPGSGPGSGGGRGGGIGIDLRGRAVVVPPRLPSDTKEEGKVVVEILVDKEGNVTEANPNGRGTTTSSPALKAKARQAALATKFNVSGKFEEQKGTITIIFSFN